MNSRKISKLSKQGGKRWLDTPRELRIRMHKTCQLEGSKFYHELDSKKGEQIIAAVLFDNGTLDVTLFMDKI